jgi:hypothetical protein
LSWLFRANGTETDAGSLSLTEVQRRKDDLTELFMTGSFSSFINLK